MNIPGAEQIEYRVLIDEKYGDVNGDGIPDRVSVYGDKIPGSDLIHNIIIKIDTGGSSSDYDTITEINGYNPSIFLGDFTKDQADDILFRADLMFNSMDSRDPGQYGMSIDTIKENQLETIFVSDRYNRDISQMELGFQIEKAEVFLPIKSRDNIRSYDLLAIHRIIGADSNETLGYLENLLSWNGESFVSRYMGIASASMVFNTP